MSQVTLAELNINLGTRDELEALADDVGLELEEGMENLALAEAVCAAIDAKDDDDWTAMSEAAKAWSNKINATKKAYKQRMAKAAGGSGEEASTAGATPDADWKSLTAPKLKAKAKELGITGYSKLNKEELIAAIDAKLATFEDTATEEAKPETTGKAKAKANNAKGKAKSKAKSKAAGKEPTKEELEAMKQTAREKADAAPAAKKQVVSEKPYKPETTAWMVTQCVKEAGKSGITQEDVLEQFKAKVKKAKAVCSNPVSRVSTILRQSINIKGLVRKQGDKLFPTAKLNKAD
jgi:hypothetical protein